MQQAEINTLPTAGCSLSLKDASFLRDWSFFSTGKALLGPLLQQRGMKTSNHWSFLTLHRHQACHQPEPGLEVSLAFYPLTHISSWDSFLSDGASPLIRIFLLVEFQWGEGEEHTDKRFPSEAGRPRHLCSSLGGCLTPHITLCPSASVPHLQHEGSIIRSLYRAAVIMKHNTRFA